jgi:hypothetical protein
MSLMRWTTDLHPFSIPIVDQCLELLSHGSEHSFRRLPHTTEKGANSGTRGLSVRNFKKSCVSRKGHIASLERLGWPHEIIKNEGADIVAENGRCWLAAIKPIFEPFQSSKGEQVYLTESKLKNRMKWQSGACAHF